MVVAFTEHQQLRSSLPAWPQHMTVVPWMNGHRLQATSRIADAVRLLPPLAVTIDGVENLGINGDTKVWTLEKTTALQNMHRAVLNAANKFDTEIEDSQFTGDCYSPHISQKTGQPELAIGDSLVLSELSIIGRHDTIGKVVLRNIALAGNEAAA